MRAERDRLQVFIKKVEVLEARRAALQHKIEVINNLKNAQAGPVRVMDEVSKALPELVWLETLSFSGRDLTLVGQAMDENAVANYIANLDASPYFREPTLVDMTRASKDAFKFNLKCVFSPTPEPMPGGETPADTSGT
jgi:type IV pilus assembly protein PilN